MPNRVCIICERDNSNRPQCYRDEIYCSEKCRKTYVKTEAQHPGFEEDRKVILNIQEKAGGTTIASAKYNAERDAPPLDIFGPKSKARRAEAAEEIL